MRKLIKLLATATIIFSSVVFAAPIPRNETAFAAVTAQLPVPPEGFVWQMYKNAAFLKPITWNERERAATISGIPTTAYAASPEEFSESQQFEMGLTLQIISGPQKNAGLEATKAVIAYLKPFVQAHKREDVLIFDQSKRRDFERTFFRYRDAPPGLKPIIVHKFILANNVTDSVHIFTFESPADTWEENWAKFGTPILGRVSVLPNLPSN